VPLTTISIFSFSFSKKELISIFYNIEGDFEKSELIDKIGEKLAK